MKPPEKTPQELESDKANELNKQMRTEVEKLIGEDLTGLEATSKALAELSQSVAYIGSRDDANLLSKSLNEALQAFTPEQAQPFIDLIQNYHKDNPVKQTFINSVEPFKANELNKQMRTELEGLAGRKLDAPELLMVAELSQSVAHIRDKEDVDTLTKCLDEVVMNLTPEQAQPILDLVNKYHENDPTKQALVSPVVKNVTLKKPEVEVALDTMGLVSSDEITQSIRDNVITKQQAYLQGEIAKTMSVKDGVAFNKKTPEEMRAYLGTEEGKAAIKEVMKTKEAQSAMNKIEVEGYREIHKIESFKNVGWTQETGTKFRIAEITNDAGDIVASLKETTVNAAPTQVTLEDGTTRTVKSYRQIDFPTNPKDIQGPVHFSMAVKDENGNNISAKDAVYFTAHYDDAGKLTEVSSPVPVKFMGDGDDAIGYIERNGKVYTLPVTQGKYREMMQQVELNNGLSVDLGQSVDSVSVPPRTVGPELQAEPLTAVEKVIVNPTLQIVDPTLVTVGNIQLEQESSLLALKVEVPLKEMILKVEHPVKVEKPVGEVSSIIEVGRVTIPEPTKLTRMTATEGIILKVEHPTVVQSVEVGHVSIPEPTKLTMMAVTEGIMLKIEQPIITNPITGGIVSAAVISKVHEIKNVVLGISEPKPEIDKGKDALDMLKNKTTKQAMEAISTAISKGDDKLVKAMMDVISPPDGKPIEGVPVVGKMALNKIYLEQMGSTKGKLDHEIAKVQRAAGAIADKAGIANHKQSVMKPKASQQER